ncbi:hypothetical protein OS188_13200 [Xanthomarina sp. F1114]|uniref:hypothetical protein n=1 Tax=Xanthomarina sp. F1114 TaxID=2996019 RepID=UPI00225E44C8|nr:hypothetical protein [Xanthomarina sp. F1114]MCX7548908.1 hypothetical protein [Xanthomarina sp. F1114]
MRFLLISFCFFLVSCGSYPKKKNFQAENSTSKEIENPYLSDSRIDYVYKASIDVYDRNFSGLLIIKKIADKEHRVAFTTEMGNKMFDFTFNENDFRVNFILDELNKKMLINILKKDFKVLITENPIISNSYSHNEIDIYEAAIYNKKHYYFFENYKLTKIINAKNGKENVQFLFLKINNHLANQIEIKHSNIKLTINLKSITQ